jgi:hypothetical protein
MMLSSMLSVLGILSLNLDFLNEPPPASPSLTSAAVQKEEQPTDEKQTSYLITGIVQEPANVPDKPAVLPSVVPVESLTGEIQEPSQYEGSKQPVMSESNLLILFAGNNQLMAAKVSQ